MAASPHFGRTDTRIDSALRPHIIARLFATMIEKHILKIVQELKLQSTTRETRARQRPGLVHARAAEAVISLGRKMTADYADCAEFGNFPASSFQSALIRENPWFSSGEKLCASRILPCQQSRPAHSGRATEGWLSPG